MTSETAALAAKIVQMRQDGHHPTKLIMSSTLWKTIEAELQGLNVQDRRFMDVPVDIDEGGTVVAFEVRR